MIDKYIQHKIRDIETIPIYEQIINHYKGIYSLMYDSDPSPIEEQLKHIIFIPKEKLQWFSTTDPKFYYTWGGPGPCFNTYTIDNYGKVWALKEKEIINYYKRGVNNDSISS